MPQPPMKLETAQDTVARVEAKLREGFRPRGMNGSGPGAIAEAAKQAIADGFCNSSATFLSRLTAAELTFGLKPDDTLYRPQRYQQPVPRAVVHDAPAPDPVQLRPAGEPVRVLVIGDLHQDPRHPHRMQVLTWIARYASEHRFDHVIQIGDWSTWDSVNFHDRNDTLGARSKPSIKADMENLQQSLQAFRNGVAVLVALDARKDSTRAKAGETLADGRTAAAGDASAIRDKADTRDAQTKATVEETIDAIEAAPDRSAANRAALRGLCELSPGADPRCRMLLADPVRLE